VIDVRAYETKGRGRCDGAGFHRHGKSPGRFMNESGQVGLMASVMNRRSAGRCGGTGVVDYTGRTMGCGLTDGRIRGST
jgi:hypothetical protein